MLASANPLGRQTGAKAFPNARLTESPTARLSGSYCWWLVHSRCTDSAQSQDGGCECPVKEPPPGSFQAGAGAHAHPGPASRTAPTRKHSTCGSHHCNSENQGDGKYNLERCRSSIRNGGVVLWRGVLQGRGRSAMPAPVVVNPPTPPPPGHYPPAPTLEKPLPDHPARSLTHDARPGPTIDNVSEIRLVI